MINNVRFGLIFQPRWVGGGLAVTDDELKTEEMPVEQILRFHKLVSSNLAEIDMEAYAKWRPVVALVNPTDNQHGVLMRGFTGEDARYVLQHYPMTRVEIPVQSQPTPLEVFDLRKLIGIEGQHKRKEFRDYIKERELRTLDLKA
jgi:hypothetical protein